MTVYLIHFDRPIGKGRMGKAQHYLGFVEDGQLWERMCKHASGQGAKIMAAVSLQYNIGWRCVRTWEGGRTLERQLKNKKRAKALCPMCSHSPTSEGLNHVARTSRLPSQSQVRVQRYLGVVEQAP
jgi:hypothetical protein